MRPRKIRIDKELVVVRSVDEVVFEQSDGKMMRVSSIANSAPTVGPPLPARPSPSLRLHAAFGARSQVCLIWAVGANKTQAVEQKKPKKFNIPAPLIYKVKDYDKVGAPHPA